MPTNTCVTVVIENYPFTTTLIFAGDSKAKTPSLNTLIELVPNE